MEVLYVRFFVVLLRLFYYGIVRYVRPDVLDGGSALCDGNSAYEEIYIWLAVGCGVRRLGLEHGVLR